MKKVLSDSSVQNNPLIKYELNKYVKEQMKKNTTGFYEQNKQMMGYNMPYTLHNQAGGNHSIKNLISSDNILNFKKISITNPSWKSSMDEYKEFIKPVMSLENINQPILTNYLSEQKLKKGIVDDITNKKGIEVQIHRSKFYILKKNYVWYFCVINKN